MAWINGQWVDEQQGFGGMLGGFGGQPRFAAGYTGDTSLDVIGGPMQPPPFGDRPGMPNLPPQMNPPGYSRGPQMQPSPFGGMLGNIDQWNPAQTPEWQPALPPGVSVIGEAIGGQPPQMYPPTPTPPRMPAPQVRPPMPVSPPYRPPMPPPPPNIGDVWPQPDDPIRELPPEMIYDPPPDWRPRTDHEFNVAQREKTKRNLATDRAKTKKHYAKLRAQGASPQTIAKAKAKSKARSKKIKGQSLRRHTIKN